jgi:hypothetical protein
MRPTCQNMLTGRSRQAGIRPIEEGHADDCQRLEIAAWNASWETEDTQ